MQERVHEQLLKPLRRCIRPHLLPSISKSQTWAHPHQKRAAIAQSVEHIIRNDGVAGSNPVCGTSFSLKINSLHQGSSFEIG